FSLTLRDDDQVFTFWQSHPTDTPALPPDETCTSKRQWVIDSPMPEKMTGLHLASSRVGDLGVGTHSDTTSDAFAPQVGEPIFPNKLAVSAQVSDRVEAKQAP